MSKGNYFNNIKISIASPKEITSWSYGEVKNSETINYRSFKPEPGGLFCEKIFGTNKSKCIYCKGKNNLKTCFVCDTEYLNNCYNRDRMGHIKLVIPICHIWYLRTLPSKLSIILGISYKKLEKVIYYENYIVLNSKVSHLKKFTVLTRSEYYRNILEYGDSIKYGIGSEALYYLLSNIDIDKEIRIMKSKIILEDKVVLFDRYRIFCIFKRNKIKLKWLMLTVLPVLPAGLRPIVRLNNGRYAISDINILYKYVLDRNNRLRRMQKINTPELIIINEKKLLQEAVDSLFDNIKSKKILRNSNRKPLKSISDNLKGKTGRFRQDLLGKRVDYSGRAVIVVDPFIKIKFCRIPIKIGIELFKPIIYNRLLKDNIFLNFISIREEVNKFSDNVIRILNDIIKDYPIILNRAPTLHRLSIQAFYPILTKKNTIFINPLVCSSYNADFDGDQMAIHLPVSKRSKYEVNELILDNNKLLSLSNGEPVIYPTQEMIIGLYLLTIKFIKISKKVLYFYNLDDVIIYYYRYKINVNNEIYLNIYNDIFVSTTIGRIIIFNEIKCFKLFKYFNDVLSKDKIILLIKKIYSYKKYDITINFVEKLKYLGFYFSTFFGYSLSIDDIIIPSLKNILLKKYIGKNIFLIKKYNSYLISNKSLCVKIKSLWLKLISIIDYIIKNISLKENKLFSNSFYCIFNSGVKNSLLQIRQLSSIKGLIYKPDTSFVTIPVLSNFKEGLSLLEYFISTSGARKGLIDTSLKTASSGYLTRRLVDVARDSIILSRNCFTKRGLYIDNIDKNKLYGRISLFNIYYKDKVLIKKDSVFINDNINLLIDKGINMVYLRSPVFCNLKKGICILCYGFDLSISRYAKIGDSVGVIAAQSIGEPGTQMTMRTFHIGGVNESNNITINKLYSSYSGYIKYSPYLKIYCKNNIINVLSNKGDIFIVDKYGMSLKTIKVYKNCILYVNNNMIINKDKLIVLYKNIPIRNRIDITESLIKISRLFEVNNIKSKSQLSDITGVVNYSFRNNNVYLYIKNNLLNKKYIIKSNKFNCIDNNSLILKFKRLSRGNIDMKDYLIKSGLNTYIINMLNKIQYIYNNQGIFINNKHIEVILSLMVRNIKVSVHKNNINIYNKEIVDHIKYFKNKKYINMYKNIVTGITKVSLNNTSFISSASFQETAKILTNAVFLNKQDTFVGVKENIISGRVPPLGTGLNLNYVNNKSIIKKMQKEKKEKAK